MLAVFLRAPGGFQGWALEEGFGCRCSFGVSWIGSILSWEKRTLRVATIASEVWLGTTLYDLREILS